MLQIFVLVALGKRIAAKAKDKGKKPWVWVVIMLGSWFFAEFSTGIMVAVVMEFNGGYDESLGMFIILPFAWAAALGSYWIISAILGNKESEVQNSPEFAEQGDFKQEEEDVF